jgi:acetylornithine/succinyldiaminopimelate/putrescine aminotransferase
VTTFGGHPLSCAAGLAALDVLLRDRLAERAAVVGERLLGELRTMIGRGGLVAVRGLGLLIGVEFDEAAACARFARRAWEQGLILNWTLHRDTVVRLAPPLVVSDDEASRAMRSIAAALRG